MNDLGSDVVTLLKQDHRNIRQMFKDMRSEPLRRDRFQEIVKYIVTHEVAEEEVVYPAVRRLEGGKAIADERIKEQAMAEEELRDMEKMSTEEFANELAQLERDVLEHAELEEATAFAMLREQLDTDELMKLGRRYQMAKQAAPTHPHPHAPNTPPGNVFLGPIVALVDNIRDAVKRR